jgi:hypothetical protein
LGEPSFSNGAAYGDLDNDGDLDLVVNNVNHESFVYKNNSGDLSKTNYISLLLKGEGQNTFAIGASIKIFQKNNIISREVMPSRGFQSSVDYKVVMGVGTKEVDSMVIVWPDHSVTKLDNPQVNKHYSLQQSQSKKYVSDSSYNISPGVLLQTVRQSFDKHSEDDHLDFYYERGLPTLLSREGPKAAHGDVNDDGLIDLYIGGASGQGGQLYLQTNNGFVKKEQKAFVASGFEDVATLFFNCDEDGDLDLFVGSGGNNHPVNSFQLQNRLYKNDGKGNFTLAINSLPLSGMNTAVVVENDFDADGDIDLFVGSRSVPQNYGIDPQSFLLVNDGTGKFTDIAKSVNPDISNMGMVTGAAWANVSGDDKKELVIVGEWMHPRIFTFTNQSFVEVKTNLENASGLWQTVTATDLDGDGKDDLVLGNIGENFYLRPSEQAPVKMWMADFDNNGTVEKIITRTVNRKDVPVFLKRELTDQVASLKKQNLRYHEFGKKSIQDLFPADVLKNCIVKVFNYSSSVVAYNKGEWNFLVKKLPAQVQFSCTNKILATDLNKDGKNDLIIGGNKFGFQPQFSRLDASYGNVLLNIGGGNFNNLAPKNSGVKLTGEIRDILEIPGANQRFLLFLQNNDYPVLYQIK